MLHWKRFTIVNLHYLLLKRDNENSKNCFASFLFFFCQIESWKHSSMNQKQWYGDDEDDIRSHSNVDQFEGILIVFVLV
jgi:hypothetical protein